MGRVRRQGRGVVVGLLAIATAAVLVPPIAVAAPLRGMLDRSFGNGGRVVSDLGETFVSSHFDAMVRQADGKLVLEGEVARKQVIERREVNGALDPSFGEDGVARIRKASSLNGLAVDGDGRILFSTPAGGASCSGATIRRLLPTGEPDLSFGSGGFAPAVPLTAYDLALDDAGNVLLSGAVPTAPCGKNIPPFDIAVTRLDANGNLDRSFGEEGVFRFHQDEYFAHPFAITIRPNGTILVAGERVLLGLTADGKLDPDFGAEGVAEVVGHLTALLALPDGGAMVAGSRTISEDPCCRERSDFTLSRYLPNGSFDPGFGSGGTATLDVDGVDRAATLVAAPGGSFVLAGASGQSDCRQEVTCVDAPILARFDDSGTLDPGFGPGGWTRMPIPDEPGPYAFEPGLSALAVTPAGQILAAGSGGSYSDAFVVATDPSGQPDPSFGAAGAIAEVRTRPSGIEASGLAVTSDGRILVSGYGDVDSHWRRGILLASKPGGGFPPRGGFAVDEEVGGLWAGRGKYAYSLWNNKIDRFDASGHRDRGYGSEGAARLPQGFHPIALDFARGGKVVAIGRFAERTGLTAVRLTSAGAPDRSFGHDGLALVRFGAGVKAEARALAVDAKGRVVLFGHSGGRSIAARLLPDGSLDRSFAEHGRLRHLPFWGYGENGVTVQPGGKVLLAGRPEYRGAPLLILRLNPDGTRDRSFGRGGRIRIETPAPSLSLFASRGRLVLVSAQWKGGAGGVVLRAYNSDGTVDRDFGHRGVVHFAGRRRRFFRPVAAALQPDGRIVVVATDGKVSAGTDVELLRFR